MFSHLVILCVTLYWRDGGVREVNVLFCDVVRGLVLGDLHTGAHVALPVQEEGEGTREVLTGGDRRAHRFPFVRAKTSQRRAEVLREGGRHFYVKIPSFATSMKYRRCVKRFPGLVVLALLFW